MTLQHAIVIMSLHFESLPPTVCILLRTYLCLLPIRRSLASVAPSQCAHTGPWCAVWHVELLSNIRYDIAFRVCIDDDGGRGAKGDNNNKNDVESDSDDVLQYVQHTCTTYSVQYT